MRLPSREAVFGAGGAGGKLDALRECVRRTQTRMTVEQLYAGIVLAREILVHSALSRSRGIFNVLLALNARISYVEAVPRARTAGRTCRRTSNSVVFLLSCLYIETKSDLCFLSRKSKHASLNIVRTHNGSSLLARTSEPVGRTCRFFLLSGVAISTILCRSFTKFRPLRCCPHSSAWYR